MSAAAPTPRPLPPAELRLTFGFRPAPEVRDWAIATFLAPGAALRNPDHEHLLSAEVAFLWADPPCYDRGKRVLGCAELVAPRGRLWGKEKQEQQLRDWFGHTPDFLVTLDANYAAEEADDLAFCALVEHELYHCAPLLDDFGSPRFTREGQPLFTVRGHDVEEFIPIVRRYGTAHSENLQALVAAATQKPSVGAVAIAQACGNCLRRVA